MTNSVLATDSVSPNREEIQTWLIIQLADVLEIERRRIDVRESFQRSGLDSLKAIGLCARLAAWLQRPLLPTLFWEYASVEALAGHLAAAPAQAIAPGSERSNGQSPGPDSGPISDSEPIAIVGMACRFPGAPDPAAFWTLLRGGVDAITEVPENRWQRERTHSDPAAPNGAGKHWAGVLPEVDTFDAGFFEIAPREAAQIDPQQRLALELSWEALEDAGLPPDRLRGGPVSVFVGVIWHDYADLHLAADAPIELHTGTGQAASIVANRISYALGLNGISIAIDSACSSSLVAVHQACQSLRSGESSLALAGGVNLMLSARTSRVLTEFGGLSPRGRCRAFDAGADGFVRGEGGGFVVLKPLSRAIADGDRIYCVIRGSAANNDGASNGLTAPSPAAQRAVLAAACARAGVEPHQIHYVEAHGTGTRLGDPIEAGALGAVLRQGRDAAAPLLVGSVKSNIGHLEGAAGIAGLIKAALSIAHRQIPPSLHFDQPNPMIDFAKLGLRVVTQLEPWPKASSPLAGVSSFGWGGTNCHVVLEGLSSERAQLHTFAAEDEAGLRAQVAAAAAALAASAPALEPGSEPSAKGPHRLAVAARTPGELAEQLEAWRDGRLASGCQQGAARPGPRRTALVFSPQGGQWRGMATGLLRVNQPFRRKLVACDAAIRRHASWSVLDELQAPAPRWSRADIVQPAIFAVQVALAAALEASGLAPDVVVGHSLGEIAAAHVAGALTLDDAARIIVHYSRLQATTADGGMALVELSAGQAAELVRPFAGAICVAGHNGPNATVLSGRPAALDALLAQLTAHGGYGARIDVDVAAHSAQMDPILDELKALLAPIRPQPCRVPMWSTSAPGPAAGPELNGAWFARNLREPVRFHEAISALAAGGVDVFVELSPHPILLRSMRQALQAAGSDALCVATLIRNRNEDDALLECLGRLFVNGVNIASGRRGTAVASAAPARLVALSAKSEKALAAAAERLAQHLAAHPEQDLDDLAFSLATTRSALEHRLAIAARSPAELREALGVAAQGQLPLSAVYGTAATSRGKRAFLFTGQGAQVAGMGSGLYAAYPAFRDAFDRCLELFDRDREATQRRKADAGPDLDRPLREVMWAQPASEASQLLDQTAYTQSALFALEYSLAKLWSSWGVEPDVVAGHSIGELVAACVAGVFSLEDAVRLVAARGRLMQALPAGGAMVSIEAPEAEAAAAVRPHAAVVSIAAINGPDQVVIAGAEEPVRAIAAAFAARGVRTRRLRVSHAFHSPLMQPMLDDFRRVAESVTYRAPALPIVSNLDAALGHDEVATAAYWVRHVREAVRFADGIQALKAAGADTFFEIGPKSMLLGLVPACLPDLEPLLIPSLRTGSDESASVLEALSRFWTAGGALRWTSLFAADAQRVPLPTYPWQRERYWIEAGARSGAHAAQSASAEGQDLSDGAAPADAQSDGTVYALEWRRQDLSASPSSQARSPRTWVLLVDRGGAGAALRAILEARNDTCITIALGARAAQPSPGHYEVDAQEPESLRTLLRELFASSQPPHGVVHLWSLDAADSPHTTAAALDEEQLRGSVSVLCLVQELVRRAWRDAPRLWLVARSAQPDGRTDDGLAISQAPVWGLGRVVALEHPELSCTRVDLSLSQPLSAHQAALLVQELDAQDGEGEVALRDDGRFVARLVPAQLPADAPPGLPVQADGSYLITGALGLPVAEQLVAAGARHLLLLDQAHSQQAAAFAATARADRGAQVLLRQADAASREDLQDLLRELDAQLPPLRGIVHTAGALAEDLVPVSELDAEKLRRKMRQRVQASWNLHALTLDRPLDFFVIYSSAASLLGYPTWGGEAAASAFVDALACQRRAAGRCALSISWGALAQDDTDGDTQSAQRSPGGIEAFTPMQAAALLGGLNAAGLAQIAVMKLDIRQWEAVYPAAAGAKLLSEIRRQEKKAQPSSLGAARFRETLAAARPEDRPGLIEKQVREALGRTLRQDALRISPQAPFRSLGLDSLMAVELRNRLESSLGAKLPLTLIFSCPNVSSLVDYLAGELERSTGVQGSQAAAASAHASPASVAAAAQTQPQAEPIAIIGMACRFPGGASTPEAYWQLLEQQRDAISEVPAERWSADPLPGDPPELRAARWGAFLADVDRFDAQFFEISPREAKHMDPQQRLLLEVTWEALERAGQAPERLKGTRTGVFTGVVLTDYEKLSTSAEVAQDMYTVTGNGHCFLAGRLSYVLGLTGPSMSVDTACSSSLVALHLACTSLRMGESTLALASGVNLLLSPSMSRLMASSKALSQDGRCKTFDAQASGYVRGEGCGVLVLKRLSDALADGDPVLALVRGSAVNQDGRSAGLTAPSGPSQKALIRQALANAGVAASDIGYVETHGTGTPLGDPIEVEALAEVLGAPRADGSRCALGAVKTNIGHLEGAAGVASVIKAVLALQHRMIPANRNFKTLNPRIVLDGTALALPTKMQPWETGAREPLAGVSSFGISGTNAHVVLAAAPEPPARERPADALPLVIPLAAKTAAARHDLLRETQRFLTDLAGSAGDTSWSLREIAATAAKRRNHHGHRLALVADSLDELRALTEAAVRGESRADIQVGHAKLDEKPKAVFVFPGQGSQWQGMARDLLANEPVFRQSIERCDQAIRREASWSLLDELSAESSQSSLYEIDIIQPALFAIGIALAALWRSWGVEPAAVVGHSMGEIAAAHVCGALSLDDAVRIICQRSRLLREVSGQGAMALVELSFSEAEAAIAGHREQLSIAASNSPRSTVLSGDPGALEAVLAQVASQGVFCRRIKVEVASHSPQMDPLKPRLLDALSSIAPRAATIPLYSTVFGRMLVGTELDAAYWVDNLRAPVLFAQTVAQLIEQHSVLFVEMSPHPILLPAIEEAEPHEGRRGVGLPSLRRDAGSRRVLMQSLAALYVRGYPLDWSRVYPGSDRCAPLPTYPWQRERYWLEASAQSSATVAAQRLPQAAAGHPLLGPSFTVANQPDARFWGCELDVRSLPYLADHRVGEQVVLPGTAYVEMALAAAKEAHAAGPYCIEQVTFERMLVLPAERAPSVQVVFTEQGSGESAFQIFGREDKSSRWLRHAAGTVRAVDSGAIDLPVGELPQAIQKRCKLEVPGAEHYAQMAARSMDYGPCFQGVEHLWLGPGEVLGRVRLPEQLAQTDTLYQIHPALLDACFQVMGALLLTHDALRGGDPIVPVGAERVRLYRHPGGSVWAHGRLRPATASEGVIGDLILSDDAGQVVAEVRGLRAQQLPSEAVLGRKPYHDWLHLLEWRPQPHVPAKSIVAQPGMWVVLMDRRGIGAALIAQLRRQGQECAEVFAGEQFQRRQPGVYEVDPESVGSFQALFDDLGSDVPCSNIVHLWSLDAAAADETTVETLAMAERLGSLSALHLVQEVVSKRGRDNPELWFVTCGAQRVGEETAPLSVAQSPLWGFARSLAMEHPELGCRSVDLSPAYSTAEAASALAKELLAIRADDQIALRPSGRYIGSLTRGVALNGGEHGSARGAQVQQKVRPDATYLITGGLGGLGLSLAEWLVGRGARHLALLGRSAPSEKAAQAIARLREQGADVRTLQADVSQHADMHRAISEIQQSMPALRGVVHAAMVLDDRTVMQLQDERFRKVMAPKVQGAWNLHQLTTRLIAHPLDFFVMYSSAAALLGSPGQSHYAAANAFLAALAHYRRSIGLTALCIDWGLFSDAGIMAARDQDGERLSYRGITALTPAQGLEILEQLIASDLTQLGVLRLNVRQWLDFYPSAAAGSMFAVLRSERGRSQSASASAPRFKEKLAQATPQDRRALLESHVCEQLSQILHAEQSWIDRDTTFGSLGVDSLMGLELRNRLEASLGIRLSVSLLFSYPTLALLVEHLLGKLELTVEPEPMPALEEGAADAEGAQLDADDVLALIDRSLDRIEHRKVARSAGGLES